MPLNTPLVALLALGCLFAGAQATRAQSLAKKLAEVKTLNCAFTVLATGTWKAGEPQSEVKPSKLTLKFDHINSDEATARLVGAFGPSDIVVRFLEGTLHFVQIFRAGPLYTTTVFPKEARPGKLQAVHTRHEWSEVSLPGFTSRPEQYYGECELGAE
jgi:hypothetical protein